MKLLIAAALVLCAPLFAGDERKPAVPEISFADLKTAVEKKTVTVIDVNGTESFNKGRIPGAIDFAAQEKSLATLLPKDKAALIVAYCGSPTCNAYKKGAEAAQSLGYTNVKHFKGGIKGWRDEKGPIEGGMKTDAKTMTYGEVTFDELKPMVEKKTVVLVDVNGSESYKRAHIPGAIDFEAKKSEMASLLPKDKNALIVAYCGSPTCNAWKRGADELAKLGYTNVKHFKGGIKGWQEAKGPVESPKS